MGIAARSAGEEPDADNAAGRGGEAQGAVVPANGFSGNSQVTVTVIEADGSSREILGEDVLSDAGGVLRHEAVLPDQIGGEYVLVEAVGLNDQG
ncbi:MAG: hypothetical protein LBK59_04455, partial [Bifidobacteriaceae bacterium]|nr:hypothetical protein [Bifidobacteriaceae bacterium]